MSADPQKAAPAWQKIAIVAILAASVFFLVGRWSKHRKANLAASSSGQAVTELREEKVTAKDMRTGGARAVHLAPSSIPKEIRLARQNVQLEAAAGLLSLPLEAKPGGLPLQIIGVAATGGGCSNTTIEEIRSDLKRRGARNVLLAIEPVSPGFKGNQAQPILAEDLGAGFRRAYTLPVVTAPLLLGAYLCSDLTHTGNCRGKPWRSGKAIAVGSASAGDGIYYAKFFVLTPASVKVPTHSLTAAGPLTALGKFRQNSGEAATHVHSDLQQVKAMEAALISPPATITPAGLVLNLPALATGCAVKS